MFLLILWLFVLFSCTNYIKCHQVTESTKIKNKNQESQQPLEPSGSKTTSSSTNNRENLTSKNVYFLFQTNAYWF